MRDIFHISGNMSDKSKESPAADEEAGTSKMEAAGTSKMLEDSEAGVSEEVEEEELIREHSVKVVYTCVKQCDKQCDTVPASVVCLDV